MAGKHDIVLPTLLFSSRKKQQDTLNSSWFGTGTRCNNDIVPVPISAEMQEIHGGFETHNLFAVLNPFQPVSSEEYKGNCV
jgi:hypothetical protein